MATSGGKGKGKEIADDDGGLINGQLSWFTPSTEFKKEPLIPLGADSIENPARPPTSGSYRLKGCFGRGESLGFSPSNIRAVDRPKGVQQDFRSPGTGFHDNHGHRRVHSEFSGPSQSVGRVHDTGRQRYIASSIPEETEDTASSEFPVRRGRGAFYFGDIPLPSNHQIYKSGLGWVPEDEAGNVSLRRTISVSQGIGIGRNEGSNLVRAKSSNYKAFSSLEPGSTTTTKSSSSSGSVWKGDEGNVPSSIGYANDKDMSSKSGTGSYHSHCPVTPKREYQPRMSKLSELTPSGSDYANKQQMLLDYISDFTADDISSDVPLLTLLCQKVMKETQKCEVLSLAVENLKGELARAQSQRHFSEKAIDELATELRLMGPRLNLDASRKILDKDVAAVIASGGMPPLDIRLNGWTYIRVGDPGESWSEEREGLIQPFPSVRSRQTAGRDPSPERTTSWVGNRGTAHLQPSPQRTSGIGGSLSPPVAPTTPKRHTWAGNDHSSGSQSSTPKRLPSREASLRFSPARPTHRHDAASASPGISSRYFNWSPREKKK